MSDTDPDPDTARYRLTEAENREIFLGEIVPERLAGAAPQRVPVVVFLVAQQGAGKGRMSVALAEQLHGRGGFVDIDSDLYKPFHPAYDRLMAQSDTLMALYTRADGRAWKAQAEEYVLEHKLNAIIQETSQDSDYVASTMLAYKQRGFRVEALVLGVPEAMSRQGIANRYYEQVQDRGSGRLTVQRNADASYTGILDLADLIDELRLVDCVAVYRRGEGEPRHSNSLDVGGRWEQKPALRAWISAERDRPWTAEETADFRKVHGKLTRAQPAK